MGDGRGEAAALRGAAGDPDLIRTCVLIQTNRYNRGSTAFRNSEVLRLLNSNQLDAVPGELNRANPQLLAGRRAAEARQFEGVPFQPPPYR